MKEINQNKFLIFLVGIVLFSWFVLATAPSFSTSGITINVTENATLHFSYNFSANVTNPDNDTLSFSVQEITSLSHTGTEISDFYWITLNSSTGVFEINATADNETGFFNVSMEVVDTVPEGEVRLFYFNVSAVNDPPNFTNLANQTLDNSRFHYILNGKDEENNTPFYYNVSFISCEPSASCELFNLTYLNETATNITFLPENSQKGEYEINFSIHDKNGSGAIYSEHVNWTLDWDLTPYFTYVCDNEPDLLVELMSQIRIPKLI
jgi:hypothetical protein